MNKKIVKESLIEGVADRYAERNFNIPDEIQGFRTREDIVPVAYVKDEGKIISIFKNPKSLENFGPGVRAISDKAGNLYIAQYDGDFIHGNMALALVNKGLINSKYHDDDIDDIYENPTNYILLLRVANSNMFSTSNSYKWAGDYSKKLLEILNKKQTKYKFFADPKHTKVE